MRSGSLEGLQQEALRPPVATHAAQPSGETGRITAKSRPWIHPVLIPVKPETGHRLVDPYVRRYWTAALGPSAISDLLRLGAAARTGKSLRRPLRLSVLLTEGLVAQQGVTVFVGDRIPSLPARHLQRLPPKLRRELDGPPTVTVAPSRH